MARYRNTRRFTAAFFMSVGIMLLAALTALWFAMPVKVQAQSFYSITDLECGSEPLPEVPLTVRFVDFGPDDTAAFLVAISEQLPRDFYVDEGVSVRVLVFANGNALAHFFTEDGACKPIGVDLDAAMLAVRAVLGDPV